MHICTKWVFLDRCNPVREVFVCVTSLWPWWLMVYCFIRQSRDNYDLLSRNCAPLRKVEKGRFVDNYALWRINWASLRFAVLLIYIFFVLSTFSWQPNKNNAKIKFLYSYTARFQDLEEMMIVPYLHQSSQWLPSPPSNTPPYHPIPHQARPRRPLYYSWDTMYNTFCIHYMSAHWTHYSVAWWKAR